MSAVEVWLRQRNILVKGFIVYEDEHTEDIELNSVSLRGSERFITSMLKGQGYIPVGRWEKTASYIDGSPTEITRRFVSDN